ncbi:hypothetical protein DRQ05_00735 [bacterium]|nr:MAG: hypothetical protein DRQ05_00735 [bacterium]
MFQTRTKLIVFIVALFIGVIFLSCSDDTSYDQRTIVVVSSINEGSPFVSDVLNQGDSLYNADNVTYKTEDDYIEEDYIPVTFYNRPYSSLIDVDNSSLGDFLVTGYDVEFIRSDGGTSPVPPFSGQTSILVPANSTVEANILIVPFYVKNQPPLVNLEYTANEIMTYAHIVFHGHEVQTDRNIDFTADISVDFADPLQGVGNHSGQ